MSLLQNSAELAAGRTVTYTRTSSSSPIVEAVVVEVKQTTAELNNGETIACSALQVLLTDERWLPVQGFADRYAISSHGKVVSLSYHQTGRQRLLRASGAQRYPSVTLYGDSRVTQVGLNRLVARHFLPPPAEARFRHLIPKDGNHLNLRADNLQWADQREREDVAVLERFYRYGARNASSKLTPELVQEIRALAAQGHSYQQLATLFGVSRPAVSLLVRRISWRTV